MNTSAIEILFEDVELAVVSKPANLVVNRADTVKEPTLQDWWLERLAASDEKVAEKQWQALVPADFSNEYGSPEEVFLERGGIVHRLDKETSGVVVLAKNPGSLVNLLRQFRLREVQKTYLCLVHGKFQILADVIRAPLGRSSDNRTRFAVDVDGRVAETAYRVLRTYVGVAAEQVVAAQPEKTVKHLRKKLEQTYQGFSLVECQPKTGRTHQIRVHMAHVRHPIVADPTYLGAKRIALDATWCSRLFLHARQLELSHPRTGERLQFSSPVPAELGAALAMLVEA